MKFENLNNLFDVNAMIDASEKAATTSIKYLPESMQAHAANLVEANYEFARAGVATATRVGKIVKTVAEETVAKARESVNLV